MRQCPDITEVMPPSVFLLLNDANPTRVQKMRHQHYATTEMYVEEVQRLLEGAEDAVTQI